MTYEAALAELQSKGLKRVLREIDSPQGAVVRSGGRDLLNFSSNDYLGLASDQRLALAAMKAIDLYGTGSGASRLVTGSLRIHHQLELAAARMKREEAALVFSSGFAANLGLLPAIAGRGDTIWIDRMSHASIVDAARLSGATLRVFPHLDAASLDAQLAKRSRERNVFIVTESYFSMDGDAADLNALARIAKKRGAKLIVDEAHAAGVFGKGGAGFVEEAGLSGQCEAVVATFSKAYGSHGGFVAGSNALIQFLVNRARSFIYSTGMPPATSAASLEALKISAAEPGLRKTLHANAARLRAKLKPLGFDLSKSLGPIVPIFVGKTSEALKLSERLLEEGILVPAIRPPTVPKGTDRLRATVTAAHTDAQIDFFCDTLKKCA